MVKVPVPYARGLLQTIDALVKAANIFFFSGDDISLWLLQINFLVELAIQKRSFHV
jgi:hypothetical protein